ncbi:hypothetical protein EXM99_08255 [Clostridium botulinum]|nr:hypothetical protein [Clostridium botulinum]
MDKIEFDMIRYLFNTSKLNMNKKEIFDHVGFFNSDEEDEKEIEKTFENLREKGIIMDWIDSSADDMSLWTHVEKYSLSTYGIKYAMDKNILSLGNIFEKIVEVQNKSNIIYNEYKHITNYIDDIRENNIKINNKIKRTEENIRETENRINESQKQSEGLKKDIISILGVFISIFTLISVNAGLLSSIESIKCKISFVLIVNGTLLTSILLIILGIKVIILEKPFKDISKIFFAICTSISIGLIAIGLYNIKYMI